MYAHLYDAARKVTFLRKAAKFVWGGPLSDEASDEGEGLMYLVGRDLRAQEKQATPGGAHSFFSLNLNGESILPPFAGSCEELCYKAG